MFCNKNLKIVCLFLCVLVICSGCGTNGGGIILDNFEESQLLMDEVQDITEETATDTEIAVHICGEVTAPGVYYFSEQVRVVDAVECAGGFTDAAATDYLNLAAYVSDGEQLYVPTKEEAAIRMVAKEAALQQRIDINTASKDVLMTLPGIGESRADDIITYRDNAGGFSTVEEIMKVSGIKQSVFEKINEKICVK